MSQHNHNLTLPLGVYSGSRFAGKCDESSIHFAEGSVARDVDISGLRFAKISAPAVDLSGLKAEASSIITLHAPGATLDGACFKGATLGMAHRLSHNVNIREEDDE